MLIFPFFHDFSHADRSSFGIQSKKKAARRNEIRQAAPLQSNILIL